MAVSELTIRGTDWHSRQSDIRRTIVGETFIIWKIMRRIDMVSSFFILQEGKDTFLLGTLQAFYGWDLGFFYQPRVKDQCSGLNHWQFNPLIEFPAEYRTVRLRQPLCFIIISEKVEDKEFLWVGLSGFLNWLKETWKDNFDFDIFPVMQYLSSPIKGRPFQAIILWVNESKIWSSYLNLNSINLFFLGNLTKRCLESYQV